MSVWKRGLCLLLCAVLLAALAVPAADAAPTLYFTAVNDRMCDLNDATMPFWQGGSLYVAGSSVDGADLGIQYYYNREASIALLIRQQSALYCDLAEGTMENKITGERYAGSAVVKGDTVFFPVAAVARIFGLKYSSTKITYGYLLRIRSEDAVLSDEAFIDAATSPIQKRYAQYERAHASSGQTSQTESPAQPQTPVRRDDMTVYLLLPVSDADEGERLLSVLGTSGCRATLLLTPETIERCGDLVRRAAATGNAVALRIGAESAEEALALCERGNALLWNAASIRTRLVYPDGGSGELRAALKEAGYCPLTVNASDFSRSGNRWAETALKWALEYGSVRLYLGADADLSSYLGTALGRLRTESCTVAALNEVAA